MRRTFARYTKGARILPASLKRGRIGRNKNKESYACNADLRCKEYPENKKERTRRLYKCRHVLSFVLLFEVCQGTDPFRFARNHQKITGTEFFIRVRYHGNGFPVLYRNNVHLEIVTYVKLTE